MSMHLMQQKKVTTRLFSVPDEFPTDPPAESIEAAEFQSRMSSSSYFTSPGDTQTTTSTIVECGLSQELASFVQVVNIILLACSLLGTALNFLAATCAVKLFRKSGDTMHIYVILMTIGDAILT
ncbi:Protein AEXR-2, partial [Aphelenchoides avenae]